MLWHFNFIAWNATQSCFSYLKIVVGMNESLSFLFCTLLLELAVL